MKILLVDDDISSVNALAILLEPEHHLSIETNGIDALNTFNKSDFDVVITDIRMPKMSGIGLLKAIRETKKKTHVIIITGYSVTDYGIEAKKYKADAFFTKPINVGNFMETLNNLEAETGKNHPPENT